MFDTVRMYYCLQCLTGKEADAARLLERLFKELELEDTIVWFPKKEIKHVVKRQITKETKPLFPGYLFFFYGHDEDKLPVFEIRRIPGMMKFLKYGDGSMALRGSDLSVARWIHHFDGDIKISKVLFKPGEKIKIVDGPMVGMEGQVCKVDRHKKRIWVIFDFAGIVNKVSFDVDFVEGGGADKVY